MLRRVGIVAALVGSALVLSGCGADKEPAAVAVTPGAPVPSPSWTPPPAGMWTESDLAEGREVPPEEMDRLRPLPEVPEEPETITHNTERGAKDAALYFARLISISMERGETEHIEALVADTCHNCSNLDKAMKELAESTRLPRCKGHDFSVTDVVPGTGEIPYYDLEVLRETHSCVEFIHSKNIVDDKVDKTVKKNWYTVRYIDGKWTPYDLSLGGKPTNAEN